MTNAELNRDVRRLWIKSKKYKSIPEAEEENYYKVILPEMEQEFKRLYYADPSFSALNRTSILIMVSLNLKFTAIPYSQFGLNIDLK